jgi:hypothetical protein
VHTESRGGGGAELVQWNRASYEGPAVEAAASGAPTSSVAARAVAYGLGGDMRGCVCGMRQGVNEREGRRKRSVGGF